MDDYERDIFRVILRDVYYRLCSIYEDMAQKEYGVAKKHLHELKTEIDELNKGLEREGIS